VGVDKFRKIFPEGFYERGRITYVSSPQDALDRANVCFVFTEWEQIRSLTPADYKAWMHPPRVFDGRNIYSPAGMKAAGVEYYCVGR
jgi:UDPglucose 6-dehydrogenase